MDRFENIIARADSWQEKSELATRLGVNPNETDPLILEIRVKADEQLALCAESISLLLRDRALPFLFRKGVRKAEAFADQCEGVLLNFDAAEQFGKAAFRDRMGL